MVLMMSPRMPRSRSAGSRPGFNVQRAEPTCSASPSRSSLAARPKAGFSRLIHIWQNVAWRATACGGNMSGRSWIVATAEQRVELRDLAGSADREEADRARAILLSLDGWTSDRIALAFCVQPDSVRHWRWIFGREGVAGLRARMAPGPDPVKARAALQQAEAGDITLLFGDESEALTHPY